MPFALPRRLTHRLRELQTATGAPLLPALLLIALCVTAFLLLAHRVGAGATTRIDTSILLWKSLYSDPILVGVALEVTSLGSIWVVWLLVLIVSALLWTARRHDFVVLIWVALLGNLALNAVLKGWYGRGRPDVFEWRTPHAGEHAFPSGHSMTAMSVYATLAYVVARLRPAPAVQWLTLVGLTLGVLMVGASRVYLGVHYPSDVLGGYLVGLAWAAASVILVELLRYRALRSDSRDARG